MSAAVDAVSRAVENSHVVRLVHPPDWTHAAVVRSRWLGVLRQHESPGYLRNIKFGRSSECLPPVHVIGTMASCARCRAEEWTIWHPAEWSPRPCDIGPCQRCDRIYGKTWLRASDGLLAAVAARYAALVADQEFKRVRRSQDWWMTEHWTSASRIFGFALTCMVYRDMLPTADELRVAWDLGCSLGIVDDPETITLTEVWAKCIPALWGDYVRPRARME